MSEIITVPENEITDLYNEAVKTHREIMVNGAIAAEALLKLCKNLKHMRDNKLYEQLGYEKFESYCEEMAGIKERMAYTYISTYENLGDSVLQSNAKLGITKLNLLTGMNPVERAEGLADGTFENMSVSEIKELIKKNREQGEQITLLTLQLENEKNEASADTDETDKLKAEFEKNYKEMSAKKTEEIKALEEELRKKESAHKIELEQLSETISAELREQLSEEIKAEMSAEQSSAETSEEIQKQIDDAVAAAKKEAEKEVKAKLKEKSDRQAEKIKALEEAITAAGTEKEKLQKQLALSDSKSAKAMVYIDALQNNFNALFAIIAEMDEEQQNKFKGAVLKLTSAMQKKSGE